MARLLRCTSTDVTEVWHVTRSFGFGSRPTKDAINALLTKDGYLGFGVIMW